MAQALKSENITLADELRELLTTSEKRIVDVRGSGAGALALLRDIDRISELWPKLEAQGVDLKPEWGRWETLQASLRRYAPRLVREVRAVGGLPSARAQHHPQGDAAWWWFLAEQVRAQRAQRLKRTGITLGLSAAAAVCLYFLLFRVLFPVDPNFSAALTAQNAGEGKIGQGDIAGALADFRRVTELQPGDADAWLRVGCTLLRLGDTAGAEENFRRAEALLADDVQLRLARAPICSLVGLVDQAEADLRAVIAADPENAVAHYYLASILEERSAWGEALAALERAAELAERSEQTQLVALARYRMAMLMQQMAGQNVAAPTPTP